ncbi:MAG: DegV family protein [Patescibacteria group bacterium]
MKLRDDVKNASVGIVTDSGADLPEPLAAAYGIAVVPLEIRLGAETYLDRVDLQPAEFFRRVREENLVPKTSQPSPGAFARVYQALAREYRSILSIHISGGFSGTCDAAAMAGRALPGADITVFDSRSLSLGQGLQVLKAARAARAGLGRDEILRLLEEARAKTEVLAILNTLESLERGGRIGKVAMLLGALLNVRPLIQVHEGRAVSIGRIRRRERAVETLLAHAASFCGRSGALLGVMHTMAAREAVELRRRLRELLGRGAEIILAEAGPVIGAHVGPEALALAYIPG